MATVNAVIRSDKINKAKDRAPIYIVLSHLGKRVKMPLKKSIDPKLWNVAKGRINGKSEEAIVINAVINKKISEYQAIIDKLEMSGNSFSLQDIRKLNEDKKPLYKEATFAVYLEDFIKNNPEHLQWSTLKKYKSLKDRIIEFRPKIILSKINYDFLEKFEAFLKKKKKNSINTVYSIMKCIRKICRKEYNKGNLKDYVFKNYKLKTEESKRQYLTSEEVSKLEAYNPANESEKLSKDLFLFSCYTGLRFSDLCALKRSDIVVEGKIIRLYFADVKTKNPFAFKIPQKAVHILMKYDYQNKDNKQVFPIIVKDINKLSQEQFDKKKESRNAYINKILKTICEKAGINKKLSFHSSRHTFATLSLSLGIPMEVLQMILHQKDLKTTQIYAKVMNKAADEAMELWDG